MIHVNISNPEGDSASARESVPPKPGRGAASHGLLLTRFPFWLIRSRQSDAGRQVRSGQVLGCCVRVTFLAAALMINPAHAQIANVNNLTTVPTPGTGHDYIGDLNENIDPASGALSVRIAVPTPQGRGISLKFAFAYDSNGVFMPVLDVHNQQDDDATTGIWWAATNGSYANSGGGWSFTWPSASWTNAIGEIFAQVNGQNTLTSDCTVLTNYVFMDSDGMRYPLYVSNGGASSPSFDCAGTSPPWWNGTGGQGPILATLQQADRSQNFNGALTVTDGDGSTYQFQGPQHGAGTSGTGPISTVASSITDRNGNYITIADSGNGAVSATDTMGRKVVAATGFGIVGNSTTNTVTVSGTTGSYQVSWETITPTFTLATNSSVTGQCTAEQSTDSLQVVQSITLPNSQTYTFGYDPVYGLLNQITYPSGAYVTYTWSAAQQANEGYYTWKYGTNNDDSNGCTVNLDTPVVTDRYVYANGANTPYTRHDQFSYSTDWNYSTDNKPWKVTTVISSDSAYTRETVYNYGQYAPPPQPWENGPTSSGGQTTYVDPAVPLELSATYEDGSGNVFRTVSETWSNPRVMTSEQTVLNGQTATTIRCFDNFEQVTQDDEYGFASDGSAAGVPSCPSGSSDGSPLSPAGPLMKQTITTYSSTLQGRNIVDRPQSVEIDGMNTNGQWTAPAAYTLYCYDQYTLTAVSPVQFADPGTATRGNATQMLKWLNSSGTTTALPSCGQSTSSIVLASNYDFDDSGQLLTASDPNGNTTTYTWGEASGEPSNPSITTDGFLLRVADSLKYHDDYTWNWSNGLMTSHSDLNQQVTHFYYTNLLTTKADAFNRLGTIDFPDGGETRIYYGDSPGNLYTEEQRQMSASQNTDSFTYFDGLGRSIDSASADGSGGWNCTNTTYDGFDEKSFVSYPYSSTSSTCAGSAVGDSSQYDALGRETQLTHSPDSSYQSWAYSGSTVTFQDENKNQWQRTSDGIGRLIAVVEPNGITPTPSMTTAYAYDALDNLFSVNQTGSGSPTARVRSFAYDSLSRLLSATNPESGTTTYVYDADGNITSKTSPAVNINSGTQTIGYCYDALNRMTYKFYSGSFSCTSPTGYAGSYSYDSSSIAGASYDTGRLTDEKALVNGTLVSERSPYQYDKMGRLLAEQQCVMSNCTSGSQYTVSYLYDLIGDPTYSSNGMSAAPPGANAPLSFTSQYNAAGHLQCLTSSWNDSMHPGALFAAQTSASSLCGQTVPVPYTAFGALQGAVLGNGAGAGVVLARSYDGRMRLQTEADTGTVVSTQ